jgi:hypothetical protein
MLFSGDTVIIMGRFLERPVPFLIEDRGGESIVEEVKRSG